MQLPSVPQRGVLGLFAKADFWTGVVVVLFAAALLWLGHDYPLGSGGRIGPGYAPRLLAILLLGLGVMLLARATVSGDRVEATFRPRPVLLVLASVLAFAVVFARAGLVPAILVSVGIANWAAPENGWRSAIGIGAVLALFSWLLFVKALRLPMPVFNF